jgi:hypothetical protein
MAGAADPARVRLRFGELPATTSVTSRTGKGIADRPASMIDRTATCSPSWLPSSAAATVAAGIAHLRPRACQRAGNRRVTIVARAIHVASDLADHARVVTNASQLSTVPCPGSYADRTRGTAPAERAPVPSPVLPNVPGALAMVGLLAMEARSTIA